MGISKQQTAQQLLLIITTLSAGLGVSVFTYVTTAGATNIPLALFNELSYFTIQSNLLVAVICTLILIKRFSTKHWARILEFGSLVNITVTGVIYYVLLRNYQSEGLMKVADIVQHYITPALYLSYWLIFRQKVKQKTGVIFTGLAYPIIFLIYTFVRGSIDGYYPYFFMNPIEIGWNQVLIYSFFITLFVLFVSFVFYMLNNRLSYKKSTGSMELN